MPQTPPYALTPAQRPQRPENTLGLDYERELAALSARQAGPTGLMPPIIDIHNHINGVEAPRIYARVMRAANISHAFTMVRIDEAHTVRRVMREAYPMHGGQANSEPSMTSSTTSITTPGTSLDESPDRVHFIAFPNFRQENRARAFGEGFLTDIARFHAELGSRCIKLWNAPRLYEVLPREQWGELIPFDAPWRVRHVELAQQLGMGIMVHVADPDTWFATKYNDASTFPPKPEHYKPLERMLDRFAGPWIAAHLGGWPEDLAFLDGLLSRHPNLWLDTSATKWIVRELSKHPKGRVLDFLHKFRGRICFGSDIVTTDEHLAPHPSGTTHPMGALADSPESAHDLYASRYLALRLMFETDYEGQSPIADPDLRMVDPSITSPLAAPPLRGLALPPDMLDDLYRRASRAFLRGVGL
jgi:hypothetical protein